MGRYGNIVSLSEGVEIQTRLREPAKERGRENRETEKETRDRNMIRGVRSMKNGDLLSK